MLTIEQSARLLKAIFPNYPILEPRNQCPPRTLGEAHELPKQRLGLRGVADKQPW